MLIIGWLIDYGWSAASADLYDECVWLCEPLSLKGIAEIPLLGYLTGPRLGLGLTLTAHV